jgi:hypothetical protein
MLLTGDKHMNVNWKSALTGGIVLVSSLFFPDSVVWLSSNTSQTANKHAFSVLTHFQGNNIWVYQLDRRRLNTTVARRRPPKPPCGGQG